MNNNKFVDCTQTGGYAVLKELGATSFGVYMAILSYRNEDTNICNPSINEIHSDFKIAVRTIKDNIDKLYDNKYLDIDSGRKDKTNRYFFPKEHWYINWKDDPVQANAKRRNNIKKTATPIAGIYLISNNETGKQYVGQATNIRNRWLSHICDLRNQTHCNKSLQADFDKYGEESFEFKILEAVEDSPILDIELNRKEEYWGKKLNVLSDGYNKANFHDPFI